MIISFFILNIAFLILIGKSLNKNKYVSVIGLYFLSVSLIILTGIMYSTRVSQYNIPINLDYKLYLMLRRIPLSVRTYARVFNWSIGAFLACTVLCDMILIKSMRKLWYFMLLVVVGFLVYTDPITTTNIYFAEVGGSAFPVAELKHMLDTFFRVIIWVFALVPLLCILYQTVTTDNFVKRRNSIVYGICVGIISAVVLWICYFGVYHKIMFWATGTSMLPHGIGDYSYIYIIFVITIVIMIVLSLIIYFDPFNSLVSIRRRGRRMSREEVEKNYRLAMHSYKNAFIGIKYMTSMAEKGIERGEYEKTLAMLKSGMKVADENIEMLSKAANAMRPNTGYLENTNVIECINESLSMGPMRDDIKIIWDKGETADAEINVLGTYTGLTEIFKNIFFNSLDAMKAKGTPAPTVLIKIQADTEYVMVNIRDNGTGIRSRDLRKIFLPFYTTKNYKNNGLGLNYVVNELRRYKGEIRAKSKYGEYTLMQIVLPLHKERNDFR